MERRFLNKFEQVQHTSNRLPHRQQDGITYFVTFRLADSIPESLFRQWGSERKNWLKFHPEPWDQKTIAEHQRLFPARIEEWLDDAHGSCRLKHADFREQVQHVLRRFEESRYRHHSFVIMPNHVHLLFSLTPGEGLQRVVQAWKGASSRAINLESGTTGAIWMKDYFDRMVRDAPHFWRCARYIRNNPRKAKLPPHAFTLFESDHVRDVLNDEACG